MSLIQSLVMFQPTSLNSKNLTIDFGVKTSNTELTLDMDVVSIISIFKEAEMININESFHFEHIFLVAKLSKKKKKVTTTELDEKNST